MSKKIVSLNGLRFFMIMVIVLIHFEEFVKNIPVFGNLFSNYFLPLGFFATNFFFVLSGFGMMLSSLNSTPDDQLKICSIKESIKYGIKHVKKIYPVYIFTVLYGLIWVFIITAYTNELSKSFYLHEVINFLSHVFLVQSATGMSFFTHHYNGVTWFLSALFCIYIISPYLIYFLRKTAKSIFIDIVYFCLELFFIVFTAVVFFKVEKSFTGIKGIPNVDILVYASPYRRVFYVLAGMSIGKIFVQIKEKISTINKATIFEILAVALTVIYSVFRKKISDNNIVYLFDVIVLSFSVFIFAFDEGLISKFLSRPNIQKLGNMAMYMFLLHYLPYIPYFFVTSTMGKIQETYFTNVVFIIVDLAFTFVSSIIIYKHDLAKKEKILQSKQS